MKKMISIVSLALSIATVAQAEIRYPDQMVTEVQCQNTGHLASGLSLTIQSGGFAGITEAVLVNRDGLGPFNHLGTIAVSRKPSQPGVMGAPVVYVGKDFELTINVDGPADAQDDFHAHVYVDIAGRVFNEPMLCSFPVHTM